MKDVNGKVKIINGDTYWMGSKVQPYPKCGIPQTNVDDCGEFGNPACPCWGIGLHEYNRRFGPFLRDKIRTDITDEELLAAAPDLLRFAVQIAEMYEGDPDYTDLLALELVKPFLTELEK